MTRKSLISPRNRRGSIADYLSMRIKEFEKKSLMPYTEERSILSLPSVYSVQFEKSGMHERIYPMALQRENEIKMKYLSIRICG